MPTTGQHTRRAVMTALGGIPIAAATHPAGSNAGAARQERSSTLVAYFSRSGNTRVVAGLIQRATGGDVFEIRPAVPYPDEYLATVKQAKNERDKGVEPALDVIKSGLEQYDTVYLGFPTTPPIIRSFLRKHDLAGKTLIPFVTHGGYGLGSSREVLASHAPNARLQSGFLMQADQERQTMDKVTDWLRSEKVVR